MCLNGTWRITTKVIIFLNFNVPIGVYNMTFKCINILHVLIFLCLFLLFVFVLFCFFSSQYFYRVKQCSTLLFHIICISIILYHLNKTVRNHFVPRAPMLLVHRSTLPINKLLSSESDLGLSTRWVPWEFRRWSASELPDGVAGTAGTETAVQRHGGTRATGIRHIRHGARSQFPGQPVRS